MLSCPFAGEILNKHKATFVFFKSVTQTSKYWGWALSAILMAIAIKSSRQWDPPDGFESQSQGQRISFPLGSEQAAFSTSPREINVSSPLQRFKHSRPMRRHGEGLVSNLSSSVSTCSYVHVMPLSWIWHRRANVDFELTAACHEVWLANMFDARFVLTCLYCFSVF